MLDFDFSNPIETAGVVYLNDGQKVSLLNVGIKIYNEGTGQS